jgi:glycine oxidase
LKSIPKAQVKLNSQDQSTHIEYIIVGQGLAGTILAYELSKHYKNILMVNEEKEFTSSKVAAGMFNPISGKRMVIGWKTSELLEDSQRTYTELEGLLNKTLFHKQNIYNVFGSVKEQNDLSMRMEDVAFAQYVNMEVKEEANVMQAFSAFEIIGSGWVNLQNLLEGYAKILKEKNALLNEKFDYAGLRCEKKKWHYKNFVSDKIVFCEGYKNIDNPYFNWLPFVLCKGDILIIKCNLTDKKIVKKGIYLVSIGEGLFKVGATYEWNDLSEKPSEKGRQFLIEKLNELLDTEYEIVNHITGIRPTTKDRRAIVGEHPEHKGMYILNGLGTKGVMQAPYLAKELISSMENNKELENEISIMRFIK